MTERSELLEMRGKLKEIFDTEAEFATRRSANPTHSVAAAQTTLAILTVDRELSETAVVSELLEMRGKLKEIFDIETDFAARQSADPTHSVAVGQTTLAILAVDRKLSETAGSADKKDKGLYALEH